MRALIAAPPGVVVGEVADTASETKDRSKSYDNLAIVQGSGPLPVSDGTRADFQLHLPGHPKKS